MAALGKSGRVDGTAGAAAGAPPPAEAGKRAKINEIYAGFTAKIESEKTRADDAERTNTAAQAALEVAQERLRGAEAANQGLTGRTRALDGDIKALRDAQEKAEAEIAGLQRDIAGLQREVAEAQGAATASAAELDKAKKDLAAAKKAGTAEDGRGSLTTAPAGTDGQGRPQTVLGVLGFKPGAKVTPQQFGEAIGEMAKRLNEALAALAAAREKNEDLNAELATQGAEFEAAYQNGRRALGQ